MLELLGPAVGFMLELLGPAVGLFMDLGFFVFLILFILPIFLALYSRSKNKVGIIILDILSMLLPFGVISYIVCVFWALDELQRKDIQKAKNYITKSKDYKKLSSAKRIAYLKKQQKETKAKITQTKSLLNSEKHKKKKRHHT